MKLQRALMLALTVSLCACSATENESQLKDAKKAIAQIEIPPLKWCVPESNFKDFSTLEMGRAITRCGSSIEFSPGGIAPIRSGQLIGVKLMLTGPDRARMSQFYGDHQRHFAVLTRNDVVLHHSTIAGSEAEDISILFESKAQEEQFLRLLLH
ncbi:MAG TPA: hypothetical protein VKM35_09880 [Arenimonas sp.]|nr:hypothetical protein [Arenimonas sp.]